MPDLCLERPTRAHIPAIKAFLEGFNSDKQNFNDELEKRFGKFDVDSILEVSTFSAVYVQEADGSVYGVFASTEIYKGGKLNQEGHSIKFACADPLVSKAFFQQALKTLFQTVYHLEYILYEGADKQWAELVGFSQGDSIGYKIGRETILSRLNIRYASVEDADGIIRLLKANDMGYLVKNDYDISKFIESEDPGARSLVAEVGNQIVGFVKTSNRVPLERLSQTYKVDVFTSSAPISRRVLRSLETLNMVKDKGSMRASNVSMSEAISTTNLNEVPELDDNNNLDETPVNVDIDNSDRTVVEVENCPPSSESFMILMFCIDPNHSFQSRDFLPKMFSVYITAKYCFLSMPTKSREMPLLDAFVSVPPKQISRETLYICPKMSLTAVELVPTQEEHIKDIYSLIEGLPEEEELTHALTSWYPQRTDMYSLMFGEFVVGVIQTLTPVKEELDQFEFESTLLCSSDAWSKSIAINNYVVDVAFAAQTRYVVEELLFRTHQSTAVAFVSASTKRTSLAALLKPHLVPIKPHKKIIYKDGLKDGQKVPPSVQKALYALSFDIMFENRVRHNSNVVVVGNTTTATSFCEQFVTDPNIQFTNITWLSPGSMSVIERADVDDIFVDSLSYWPKELGQLGIKESVNLIDDQLAEINRKEKYIQTTDGTFIPYDFLILACGQQFYPDSLSKEFCSLYNAVGINRASESQISRSFDYLVHHGLHSTDNPDKPYVIVYGRDIQAYSLVGYLLDRGFSASAIIMVIPPESTQLFSKSEYCDEKIRAITTEAGVSIVSGSLKSWKIRGSQLVSVVVKQADGSEQEYQTAYLYYCDVKTTNSAVFTAINNSSLVFDGRLVIDQNFKTHDPFIFGAGVLTKYSSKYKTKWCQAFYETREVGSRLAAVLMQYFDPMADPISTELQLPEFSDCKRIACKLPQGNRYFRLDKPHLENDVYDVRKKQNHGLHGRILETRTDLGFFQLHVKPNSRIRSITYLGKSPIAPSNFLCLYNLPAACCNNMIERYEDGLIPDFVKFFEEQWAYAVFDYRFQQTVEDIVESVLGNGEFQEIRAITEALEKVKMNSPQMYELYEKFDHLISRPKIDSQAWPVLKEYLPGCQK